MYSKNSFLKGNPNETHFNSSNHNNKLPQVIVK